MGPLPVVLHPTDFSPPAENAMNLACSLARVQRARLVVLHVAPPAPVSMSKVGQGLAGGGYKEHAWKALCAVSRPAPTLSVEFRVEEGHPAQEILRVARELPTDLIVMGTHGRTGLGRLLMGSVAEEVVRKAVAPVLTVKVPASDTESLTRQPAWMPIRSILHPTDFTERARAAFRVGCSLAVHHGARLYVAHVAPTPFVYRNTAVPVSGEEIGTIQGPLRMYKNDLLERLRQFASPEPEVPVECEILEGDPAEAILAWATRVQADLIVMGTHGRTDLGRLLMGSVAEQVLCKALCPVMTVKTAMSFPPQDTLGLHRRYR